MRLCKYNIVLLALMLLVACTKDGVASGESDQLISFSPATSSTSTKSGENIVGIIQNTTFPTDRTFAMNVFRMDFDEYGNPTMDGGYIFMNMEQVKYNTSDDDWHTDAHHYWPLSGGLYCLGFCPAPDSLKKHKMLNSMTADYNGTLLFTGIDIKHVDDSENPITDDAAKTDANLSHAKIDLMTSTSTVDDVQKRSSNKVPVTFTHALTQLKFTVEAAKDYSSYTLYQTIGTSPKDTSWYWTRWQQYWVDEIKLTNIYSKGTYSFSSPHWNTISDLYTYYPLRKPDRGGTQALFKLTESSDPGDNLADKTNFGTRIPYQTPITTDGSNELCILLIPQLVSDDAELEMTINSRTANLLIPDKDDVQSHIMNDLDVEIVKTFKLKNFLPLLRSGVCYTINFKISQDAISIGVDYTDWDDGKTTENVM